MRDTALSCKVSGVWTFRSDTHGEQTALPLSVVRFTPQLDDNGFGRAGQMLSVPISTQSQVDSVRVDVRRGVLRRRHHVEAPGRSPATACCWRTRRTRKSVSLRAKASGNGQTVEQTIVNAYLLK